MPSSKTEENKPDPIINESCKDKDVSYGTDDGDKKHPGWNVVGGEQIAAAVGIRDLSGIMGDHKAAMLRQHLLNPEKYKTEYKRPNPGKMPNNRDPFPVDLKIEELETHYPPTRINEITTHVHGEPAAKAAMNVGHNADKRLAKLENNMATLMRLFFRLGSRVNINCVYYGGQTPFEKYNGIRCLCDDRISDGQAVQIDQCLTCTRYEPVFGQCYELMNDLGANVAAVLDNNQMSYSNMEDYTQLTRTENFHEEKDRSKFNLDLVQTRSPDERDFSSAWGQGVKMNWNYVPLEDQRTHINWRQSINDDGSNLRRLNSFPCNEMNAGANIVYNSNGGNAMEANRAAMDAYDPSKIRNDEYDREVASLISAGKASIGNKDDCINLFRGESMADLKKLCAAESIDPLVIASIGFCTGSRDYEGILNRYKDIAYKIDTQNPAVIISAYNTSIEVFLGRKSEDRRRQEVPRIDVPPSDKKNQTGRQDRSSDDQPNEDGDGLNLNWEERSSWMWPDFAKRFIRRAKMINSSFTNVDLFPRVCYLYCVVLPECQNSRFDEGVFGFPFFDEQFAHGITYSSAYGWREQFGRMHYGIDLGADAGEEIHAIHDGNVAEDGTGNAWGPWHGICIDHGDGTYSRYLHCDTMSVSVGQRVTRGQIIGTVGGYGQSGPNTYAPHLHFEIGHGDALASKSQNPLDFYPRFASTVHVGDQLTVS